MQTSVVRGNTLEELSKDRAEVEEVLENLEKTFDHSRIASLPMETGILKNLPFFSYFVVNDFDMSLILTSGHFMKYSISIEDLYKSQYASYVKHYKHMLQLLGTLDPKKSDEAYRTELIICAHSPNYFNFNQEVKSKSDIAKIIYKELLNPSVSANVKTLIGGGCIQPDLRMKSKMASFL